MENLSKEYMINQITSHKEIIRDATDRLSDVLYKARVSRERKLSEEDSLAVRKILHEIVSELSIIGGYCDNWTKSYIDETVRLMSAVTSRRLYFEDVIALDLWAMRINSIMIDYNKTPFRLSELKPLFSMLKKVLEKL